MRLNNECVRDLLLAIEENLGINDKVSIDDFELPNYSNDELIYTALKLIEAGFINGDSSKMIDGSIFVYVSSLTWDGHKFLDNIRDNEVWRKTKSIVSKFSSVSLGIISNVAAQVITALIKQQLGQ